MPMEALDLRKLPRRSDLVKPLQLIEGFDADDDLTGTRTRQYYLDLIEYLEDHARFPALLRLEPTEVEGKHEDLASREKLRMYLELLRHLYGGLRGASAEFLQREVLRSFPDLAERFSKARAGAIEGVRQARALLAFLLGDPEDDDQALGVELIPRPKPTGRPRPAVKRDL